MRSRQAGGVRRGLAHAGQDRGRAAGARGLHDVVAGRGEQAVGLGVELDPGERPALVEGATEVPARSDLGVRPGPVVGLVGVGDAEVGDGAEAVRDPQDAAPLGLAQGAVVGGRGARHGTEAAHQGAVEGAADGAPRGEPAAGDGLQRARGGGDRLRQPGVLGGVGEPQLELDVGEAGEVGGHGRCLRALGPELPGGRRRQLRPAATRRGPPSRGSAGGRRCRRGCRRRSGWRGS